MKHNKYVKHKDVKMYCWTNQLTELKFLGPKNKPHGVCGLCNHYHLCFYTKLGHGTYAIRHITCACTLWTYSINQPCFTALPAHQHTSYQLVQDYTHWPMLGSFNKWNIIKLLHKATSSEKNWQNSSSCNRRHQW